MAIAVVIAVPISLFVAWVFDLEGLKMAIVTGAVGYAVNLGVMQAYQE